MSFGSTKHQPPDPPKLMGADRNRIATHESARALPWFAGTRWLGVTWVGEAFNVRTEPIRKKVGKDKTTVGHNYYASFAALISGGTVDSLTHIKIDEETAWRGDIIRGDEDYVSITIEGHGTFRFYWGSDTQVIDSLLNSSGLNHSSYRGQCYLVGDDIFFGPNRTTAPNIQVRVKRFPRPSWMSEADSKFENTDSNPIAILYDWWTNERFGLGRSEDSLDQTRLVSASDQLVTEGIGLSPLLDSDEDFQKALLKLLEHIDGYPTSYNRKFGIELVRPATGTIPFLNDSDLLSDPSISGQTWEETFDEVRIRFPDDEMGGADNSVKHHELANFQLVGRHRAQNHDRPWIVRQAVASKLIGAIGRIAAYPTLTGSLRARESQVDDIGLGSVFDMWTRDRQTLRLRCESRTEPDPDSREVTIRFESDRGWAYEAGAFEAGAHSNVSLTFTPEAPYEVRILDAPYALIQNYPEPNLVPSLMYMVARNNTHDTTFDVWRASAQSGPYTSATEHRDGSFFSRWSLRAQLKSDILRDSDVIDEVGFTFEVLSPDATLLSSDEWDLNDALNHKLLAFFGTGAFEIMSLYDIVQTSSTMFTAKMVRGLYDTRRILLREGTEMWLRSRFDIQIDQWPPESNVGRWYKFQPYFISKSVELTSLTAQSHLDEGRNLLPLPPANPRVNGDRFGATWVTGEDTTVTWNNTSRERTVFGLGLTENPPTDLTEVLIELWSYIGLVKHASETISVYDSVYIYSLSPEAEKTSIFTNAYLVANVNADYSLRFYGIRNGRKSRLYNEIKVRKV